MKLDLDPEKLRLDMQLWKEVVDLQMPMRQELMSHMLEHRVEILSNYLAVARNWLTFLHACNASGEDLQQLDALKADIREFKAFAEKGLKDMNELLTEDSSGVLRALHFARRRAEDISRRTPRTPGQPDPQP